MASPERTCVGCRGTGSKRDLVRVVRAPGGAVAVDPAGSAAGRGSYVHRANGCVEAAIRSKAFERALRTSLSADAAARLGTELERMMGAA
jgi:predicted RNA-binding protein YlxR (DUF448 family)